MSANKHFISFIFLLLIFYLIVIHDYHELYGIYAS